MSNLPIEIVVKPASNFSGFTAFKNANDLKENILAGHSIIFSADLATKTMIATTVQCGDASLNMNLDLEGFNLWEREEYSALSCRSHMNIVFKLSKKHNKEEYLNYLRAAIAHLFKDMGIEREQQSFILATNAFTA